MESCSNSVILYRLLFFSTKNRSRNLFTCLLMLLPAIPFNGRFACFLFSMTRFCNNSAGNAFFSVRASSKT